MDGLFGSGHALRVNVTKDEYGLYDDTVYVEYLPASEEGGRILEEDIIPFTVWQMDWKHTNPLWGNKFQYLKLQQCILT